MDKGQLIQRLMATFLEELAEHVRTLNAELLALEKGALAAEQARRLKVLFRAAHSLKGAARSVNVTLIEGACHHLEELLAAVRDGVLTLTPAHFALLFATADGIEEAGMRLREQHDLSDAPLAGLLPRLDAAATGAAFAAPPRAAPPEAAPPPGHEAPEAPGPPPPPPPALSEAPSEAHVGSGTVRIPAERLDELLAHAGELLVARRRVEARGDDVGALLALVSRWQAGWHRAERALHKLLAGGKTGTAATMTVPRRLTATVRHTADNLRRLEKGLEQLGAGITSDGRFLKQVIAPLSEAVHRARMLPFAEACAGLDRTARDLAQAAGKEVELVLEGGAVELDRSVLEGLKDPLRHLVRNAVGHGAEPPAERRAAGKSPQARVTVGATLCGARVEVTVQDDGRGLDLAALRAAVRRAGLAEPADEGELVQLIFLPGLSTSLTVNDVSGRGMGLDVVKSHVEALHGTVAIRPSADGGTTFTLTVPLTLTTLRAVLVSAGGQTYALAGTNVQRVVRVGPEELCQVAGRRMLSLGGAPLPVASLAAVLGTGGPPEPVAGKLTAVVVAAGEKRVVLVVDAVLAEQEIVIKALGARVRRLRHVAAATLLPSGHIALLLNAAGVARTALASAEALLQPTAAPAAAPAPKRLLVADDSVTTRTLEKTILEAAGYEVLIAPDGAAAWRLLQERGADLLVSDVEMPLMDGFALTEAVRASPRFRTLPVVLVTGRASDEDRARGLRAGADAYLVKSGFDQRALLEAIGRLL